MGYVIVFLGAGIGGALRHGVNVLAARWFGIGFPFGTIAVNIIGCFGMALVIEYFAFKAGLPQQARLFRQPASWVASRRFRPSRSTPQYCSSAGSLV